MAGLKYWVWLNECRGLTNRSRALLLDHFGSPEDVYYADEAEYALVEGLSKKQFELLADKSTDGADKILGDCQRLGLRILTMQDADYPARLRGIFEPPCLLYVKGTLPAFDEEVAVAMVGTRACTPYGTQSAEKIAYGLAKQGALVVSGAAKDNTKVIAHRGYWKTEGSAQNSIRSLERASEIGAYGSEFDVHLTADNVLVIFHDNDIQGKHIQSCTYDELKDLQLSNGEKLPTLEQYLKRAKKLKNVRLILELKAHETPERNREAAKAVVDMVKRMKLAKRTDYISFNMDACKEFIRLCPKSEVSYLNGELSPMELKELGFTGLDYHYKVLQSHPDWVKDCKVLGMTSNVWTVDDPKLMEEMIDLGVDFITTDLPEETQKILHSRAQ